MFHCVELRTEDHIELLFGGCLTVLALNLIHLKVLSSEKITYFLQWLGVQSLHFLQNSNLLLFIDFVRVSFFATHKLQSQWSPSRIVHSLTFFSSSGYSFFISTHDMKGYIYIFFLSHNAQWVYFTKARFWRWNPIRTAISSIWTPSSLRAMIRALSPMFVVV